MNVPMVIKQLGLLLLVLSAFLVALSAYALAEWLWGAGGAAERRALVALASSAATGALAGLLLWLFARKPEPHLGRREALLLVALSWIIGAALAALPYLLWARLQPGRFPHVFTNFVDCYFEAMSGLTTTGASVVADVEALPRSILLWRSLTHWLGGLGIVVFFVAVLPSLGAGGRRLVRFETPGADPDGLRPQIRETARVLWIIYLALTVAQIVLLMGVGRMSWFDSVCHTFATVASGGFSTKNQSIGYYDSVAVDVIVIVFMILAGANFGLYYRIARKKFAAVTGDVELRVYLLLLAAGSAIVLLSVHFAAEPIVLTTGARVAPDYWNSLRHSTFVVVSQQSTTGFCTADYDRWPFLAKAVIILLMFAGGSSGSTGGGIKVIRLWIALKVLLSELERAYRPNVIRPIRAAGAVIDADVKVAAITYVLGFVALFVAGAVIVTLFEQWSGGTCDFTTAASASVATLSNVGPGLRGVGPIANFSWLSDGSKVVLSILMLLGRLEVFAIFVLLTPRFWTAK